MFGLLRRAEGRLYGRDALEVARTAAALTAYGVEARHLRTVRAAVEREVNLIEHVVAPILKQRGAGARELAGQTAGELAGLAMRLHRALIEGALAEAGLIEAGLAEAGLPRGHGRRVGPRGTGRGPPFRRRRGERMSPLAGIRAQGRGPGTRDTGCTLTKGVPASTRGMAVSRVRN